MENVASFLSRPDRPITPRRALIKYSYLSFLNCRFDNLFFRLRITEDSDFLRIIVSGMFASEIWKILCIDFNDFANAFLAIILAFVFVAFRRSSSSFVPYGIPAGRRAHDFSESRGSGPYRSQMASICLTGWSRPFSFGSPFNSRSQSFASVDDVGCDRTRRCTHTHTTHTQYKRPRTHARTKGYSRGRTRTSGARKCTTPHGSLNAFL